MHMLGWVNWLGSGVGIGYSGAVLVVVKTGRTRMQLMRSCEEP